MNRQQFLEMLCQDAYPAPTEVKQPANGLLGEHIHPFAVKALVLDGAIKITTSENTRIYEVGDVFELDYQQVHSESYGPKGVCYLASRKYEKSKRLL